MKLPDIVLFVAEKVDRRFHIELKENQKTIKSKMDFLKKSLPLKHLKQRDSDLKLHLMVLIDT